MYIQTYPCNIVKLTYTVLKQLVAKYIGEQIINVSLTGDYKTDRKLIFGKGGFIKDKPLIKALMIICGYKNVVGYITPDEYFEGEPVSIYGDKYGKLWFIEVASALLARVTNYYEAIQGVRDENPEDIVADISYLIKELIVDKQLPIYITKFTLDLLSDRYRVSVEIYKKKI